MEAGERFDRYSGSMRRLDHVGTAAEQVRGGIGWFGIPYVQSRDRHDAIIEGLSEITLHNEAASTDIHQDEPGPSGS